MAANAAKAAMAYSKTLDDPAEFGAANRVKAANEILDRIGLAKKATLEVQGQPSAVIILPPKAETNL